MKITKEQLKQIIKEELETIMSEYSAQGAEDEMEKKLQTELDRYESMRQALIKTGDVNMAGFGGHKDQVPSPKEALAILAKKIKEITDELQRRGKAPGMPSYAGTKFGGDDRFEQ